MTAVVETLRRLSGSRPSDVVERLSGLSQAVDASRGRVDTRLVEEAATIVDRASARLRLSSEHTVVALAGATGSGKSSLFNALCNLDLAAVGVKRPTTSWALACAWGPEGAGELLDWLEIPKRHQVNRMGMLDETAADRDLQGLVLLDLPDHDSTEVSHHLEVERLIRLADVFVWVLDPQKYADAAIHDRFLRPLQSHSDVMMVVLNHIDEIPAAEVDRCLGDVRRLLALDGLADVPVFGTSGKRGDGMEELRQALTQRVSEKKLARERLSADVKTMAARMAEQTGNGFPTDVRGTARGELLDACIDAAGVPIVVEAIGTASLLRARRATGWPATSWLSRFRRDPMRKLDLPESGEGGDPLSASDLRAMRTRMPTPNNVQRARVDSAVRDVADTVTEGMGKPWENAVRAASVARIDDLTHALSDAVAATDLGVKSNPWWWNAVRVLQWVLFVAAVVGAGWLVGLAAMDVLKLDEPNTPEVAGLAVPTALLLGGLAVGVVLAMLCRVLVRISARRRAHRAEQRLVAAIERVTDDLIVLPVQAEVDAYITARDGLHTALKD
jgi:GTP-binding protein EngB required for normal cell division